MLDLHLVVVLQLSWAGLVAGYCAVKRVSVLTLLKHWRYHTTTGMGMHEVQIVLGSVALQKHATQVDITLLWKGLWLCKLANYWSDGCTTLHSTVCCYTATVGLTVTVLFADGRNKPTHST